MSGTKTLETIAVYRESIIKTYGFQTVTDLSLFRISFEPRRMDEWGSLLWQLGELKTDFYLMINQYSGHQALRIYLVLKHKWEDTIRGHFENSMGQDANMHLSIDSPVEVVYFYGPHFGDRYGIADATFSVLGKKDIPILAAGCTGASIFIVFPEKRAREARNVLTEAFEIP